VDRAEQAQLCAPAAKQPRAVTMPDRFRFDPLREEDLPLLRDWLCRPHVARWWGAAESIDTLRADYIVGTDVAGATRAYIASLDAEPVGFIQAYVVMGSGGGWWTTETDPGARGIDQFLADAGRLNQGLGRRMIRAFVGSLFDDPLVSVVQADPDPRNARAIRCYAAAGFREVGAVDTPDGKALLMRCTRASLAEP
jgi:RimJ/RimL family protein N-acetyltransferase